MYELWAGTSESLRNLFSLQAQYLQQLQPVAQDQHEIEMCPDFHVPTTRAGLMLLERQGNLAILRIGGSLVQSHQWWHEYVVGQITSYFAIKDAVHILTSDQSITNVLVLVDSGGGAVSGVDSAARALTKLRGKNVMAHSENGAGSAGYWLACSIPKLYASPMAVMGNIGTMMLMPDLSGMYKDMNIEFHLFKAGKEKGYGLPQIEFSEEEKAMLQGHVEKSNNFFVSHVSSMRNLLVSDHEVWGDAKIFFGGEAKAVGLVDGVATLEEVTGKLFASNTIGDHGMPISEEKLAQISAGAAPESVLTLAELAVYQQQLKTTAETPEVPVDANGTVVEPTPEVKAEPEVVSDTSMAILLGKTQAKLEASEAKVVEMTEAKEALATQMSSLLVVAQAAVSNLQVALQLPKEVKASAPELLAQYNSLQTEMQARFPVGKKSATAEITDTVVVKTATAHPLRPH